jgi:hypothetical protein
MAKNQNIDDDTRKRALAFVEKNNKEYRSDPYSAMTKKERDARVGYPDDFPPAVVDDATKRLPTKKARVVSKKELEESGLSLRDFLNKERGLTRREDKADSKVEAAKKQLKLGEKVSAEEVDKAKKQLKLAKGGYVNCGASVPAAQKRK